ncbi:MAG: hypothetical protein IT285_03130 [Bdellovibrionales bacterium]|nr:hypothetical protein [Bdellovibrionales bacterium]
MNQILRLRWALVAPLALSMLTLSLPSTAEAQQSSDETAVRLRAGRASEGDGFLLSLLLLADGVSRLGGSSRRDRSRRPEPAAVNTESDDLSYGYCGVTPSGDGYCGYERDLQPVCVDHAQAAEGQDQGESGGYTGVTEDGSGFTGYSAD